ncbi:hypothetical protein [Agromyces sp. GXQ0307]|uniref:hypothetical protein n=1 Tax=Agromyces sp. GXQ0307 TaxID=3377835 RepID=UPI00383A5F04
MSRTKGGEFSKNTRDRLAAWAGYKCSAPWCDKTTIAGSSSTKSGVSNLGEAAHILGRTPTSARYDENQSERERKHFDNGIWLCRQDAAAIDRNDSIFTADLLRQWKESRAEEARRDQTAGPDGSLPKLFDFEIRFDLVSDLSVESIHSFLEAAGVSAAWGGDAQGAAERLVFELLDNARRHGSATSAILQTGGAKVQMTHGSPSGHFGVSELLGTKSEKGGYVGVASWTDSWNAQFRLASHSDVSGTTWTLTDVRSGDGAPGPCSEVVAYKRMTNGGAPHTFAADCSEVVLYVEGRVSYSDVVQLRPTLNSALARGPVLIVSKFEDNLEVFNSVNTYSAAGWKITRSGSALRLEL